MKKVLTIALFLFTLVFLHGQHIPLGINYQAIARDNAGNELKNTNLSVRISIISDKTNGNIVYSETHSVTTDLFGLFKLVIGQGSYYSGEVNDFAAIPWGESSHFLKVEVNFGDGFISMGTMPFLAVPYALYAANAGETGGAEDLDKDPENELQFLSSDGSSLSISRGNTIPLSDIRDDADADPQNEIQDLKLEGQNLRLTRNPDPTIINLEAYLDNTDNQELNVDKKNNTLTISKGNSVQIDTDTTNELQEISLSGYDLSLSRNGGSVNIKPDIIAFRAIKNTESTLAAGDEVPSLKFNEQRLDTGEEPGDELGYYNQDNGVFTVPTLGNGLYHFDLTYNFASSQTLEILLNGEVYEVIFENYGGVSGIHSYSFILMLNDGDKVNIRLLNQSFSICGRGTFSGYRIH
ncbi:MAG: C1q-like domain-containing protein [Bacteroidota bacterium]